MRISIFGAPWRSRFASTKKISGTSIKSFHEMKRDRDGKSAKRSATRYCHSAVVVNDHMYPRPYIVCDSKGVIET